MSAGKGHKNDGQYLTRANLSPVILFNQREILCLEAGTDRDNHATTVFQLSYQWWRNMADCRSDDNAIKRRLLLPAVITIRDIGFDIVVTQPGKQVA